MITVLDDLLRPLLVSSFVLDVVPGGFSLLAVVRTGLDPLHLFCLHIATGGRV
jgi:hypothetical protein